MLRIKKYNQINKNSMIQFLKKFKYDETDIFDTKIYDLKYSICYFYLYLKKYINTNIIKKYNIHFLSSYLFCFMETSPKFQALLFQNALEGFLNLCVHSRCDRV